MKLAHYTSLITAAAIAAVFYIIMIQYMECQDQGGQLVRGLLWFTCIK